MSEPYSYARSEQLFAEAQEIIPGGTLITARPYIRGASPIYVDHAKGSHLWDVDGNEYVDFTLALGPVILGYADDVVDAAVVEQMRRGNLCTLNSPLQLELARLLVRHVPAIETATFFKTGSDATYAAVRIARTYTGREKVIRCGYHGWHDWCSPGAAGVPEATKQYTLAMEYNNLDNLAGLLEGNPGQVACVIMQPGGDTAKPKPGYLEGVKELAAAHGVVLIFDEVRSGFRMGLSCSQGYFGVTPDMTTLSKAMANGYPMGVVGGKREIMQAADRTWLGATFNGEAVSLAAAVTTIKELERRDAVEHIWKVGQRLLDGLSSLIAASGVEAETYGYAPMPHLRFTYADQAARDQARNAFFAHVLGRGMLMHPTHHWFMCNALTVADVDRALEVSEEGFRVVKQAMG